LAQAILIWKSFFSLLIFFQTRGLDSVIFPTMSNSYLLIFLCATAAAAHELDPAGADVQALVQSSISASDRLADESTNVQQKAVQMINDAARQEVTGNITILRAGEAGAEGLSAAVEQAASSITLLTAKKDDNSASIKADEYRRSRRRRSPYRSEQPYSRRRGPASPRFDDDGCLAQSPNWGSSYTCAGGASYCSVWAKDMHRCCSKTCSVDAVRDDASCNGLSAQGTCGNYPEAPFKCPAAWTQVGPLNADVAGCGLQACGQRYGKKTITECATFCASTSNCASFTWAPKNGDRNHMNSPVCTMYNVDRNTGIWSPKQIMCKKP